MRHVITAIVAATVLLAGSPANGQHRPVVSLTPEDPARWDVAAHIGWLGGYEPEIGPDWDEWYEAPSFGASLGYYWTTHTKFEVEVSTTTEGRIFTQEAVVLPDQPFPFFRSREHFFRRSTVAGGVSYQFLENAWFHPFAGAGLEWTRQTRRSELPAQMVPGRGDPNPLPAGSPEREASYAARPFLAAGFKWYVSERAFIRSDLRTSFSTEHAESVTWRGGVGFDF